MMAERLTRRAETDEEKAVWYGDRDVFLEGEVGYAEADKLAHYEDLEEQGYKMINIDKVVEQLEINFDRWGLDEGKKEIMREIVRNGAEW